MAKLKKKSEYLFDKGEHYDDELYKVMRDLNPYLTKPLDKDGEEDCFSYSSILSKKVKIVLYVED